MPEPDRRQHDRAGCGSGGELGAVAGAEPGAAVGAGAERQRRRQLAEIERLLEDGQEERAGGLLVEHLARFPDDATAAGLLVARCRRPDRTDRSREGP